MWRIRSKLHSQASFFAIRCARSARADLTETRVGRPDRREVVPARPGFEEEAGWIVGEAARPLRSVGGATRILDVAGVALSSCVRSVTVSLQSTSIPIGRYAQFHDA